MEIIKRGNNARFVSGKEKSFVAQCRGKLCYSFDFGEYSTKITAARVKKGSVEVKKLVVVENDEHAEKLNEKNIKEWRNRISRELKKNNLNPKGQIGICSVSSRHYIGRQISVPYAEKEDLLGIVAYELSQILELDMKAYVFRYKLISTYEENGIHMCSVWAVAVPAAICDNYYRLMEALHLKPLRMDVNVNGLEYLCDAESSLNPEFSEGSAAFIDFGMKGTEISILRDGKRFQVSNIDYGENRLVSAAKIVYGPQIADIHNGNKLTAPPQKIYEIIQQAKSSDSAAVFADAVEKWIIEVNNVIRRYNIDNQDTPIEHIYVFGGSQQLSWLKNYVDKYTGVPTEILSELSYCRFPSRLRDTDEEIPKFLISLAVLMRSENDAFNLFETYGRKNKSSGSMSSSAMIAGAAAIVLICAGIYGYTAFRGMMLEEQYEYLKSIESSEELLKAYTSALAMNDLIVTSGEEKEFADQMNAAVRLANTARTELNRCIEECAGEDVFLRSYTVKGRNISLQGYVKDIPTLTEVERRFRNTDRFEKVIIRTINNEGGEDEEETVTEPEEEITESTSDPAEADADDRKGLPGHVTFSCELVLKGVNADEEQ